MIVKLRTEEVNKIEIVTLNNCFNCSYMLDLDDSGFETYDLRTNEKTKTIVKRLRDKGFKEIKIILSNRLEHLHKKN